MVSETDVLLPQSTPHPKRSTAVSTKMLLILASLVVLAVFAANRDGNRPQANLRETEDNFESASIQITNSYGGQPDAITSGMYPWSTSVVEPYRSTTFTLIGGTSSQSWNWRVVDLQTDEVLSLATERIDATQVEFTMEKPGGFLFEVVATSYDVDNQKTVVKEPFVTKYVRRELRNLDSTDREEYLGALLIMYTTRMREGRELYGDEFISSDYFTRWHLGAKGDQSPYHGAPSFFTAHAYFASLMERSLQSISPSLAMHYWDFTIDAEEFAPPKSWDQSFLFSENWFGPNTEKSDTEKRVRGRFHDVKLMRNVSAHNHINPTKTNSYGFLTEQFNNNPSEYLTRSYSICGMRTTSYQLPNCEVLKGTFTEFDSMVSFHSTTEFDLHISFHSVLGGMWDCALDLDAEIKKKGDHFLRAFTQASLDLMSLFVTGYYEGHYVCPGECALDVSFEDCRCEDVELLKALEEDDETTLTDFFFTRVINLLGRATPHLNDLLDWNSEKTMVYIEGYDEDEVYYIMKSILQLLSIIPKLGQFASPLGSGSDPLFWPLHVNWERNWQYMRLDKKMNSSWTNGGVDESEKYGWGYDDPLEPMNDFYGITKGPGEYFTNHDLVKLLDPTLITLPYMWDDFSWPACD